MFVCFSIKISKCSFKKLDEYRIKIIQICITDIYFNILLYFLSVPPPHSRLFFYLLRCNHTQLIFLLISCFDYPQAHLDFTSMLFILIEGLLRVESHLI